MIAIRSVLFNAAFYVLLIGWMIGLLPVFLARRRTMLWGIQGWARASVRLLHLVAGTRVEVRGREHVPVGGLIVAAKHQSFLEVLVLLAEFDDPTYVFKRELSWIPLWGWFLRKAEQVSIDRGGRSAALAALTGQARVETARGRQIIIFPEGTRRPPGAPPAYKYGVVHIYDSCGVPCLPVALNTGLYWPRRSLLRRPGTAVIEFLPPIPPGLPREAALEAISARIEQASDRLLAEGLRALGDAAPAVPPAPAAEARDNV